MKTIVLSGINLFEGGPLSIYRDCLQAICEKNIDKSNRIIAFVHKKALFSEFEQSNIEFVELQKSRKSYLYRFYYEYIYFKKFSKGLNIDVWLSLHDITPNVKAKRRYVYCHNPIIFYRLKKIDYKYGKKYVFFKFFYKWIYRINIKKNTNVIVQQNWIKKRFEKTFRINNVIVSKPLFNKMHIKVNEQRCEDNICTFFFPSYPRIFKNFEIICEAVKLLEKENIKFKVLFTLDGDENAYSKYLYNRYKGLKSIEWLGILERSEVFSYYENVDCLIFPSRLETWGLPISEFKVTGKPIILVDLQYAHETLGEYNNAGFFQCTDISELTRLMKKVIGGQKLKKILYSSDVMLNGWEETIDKLLTE